jgi:2-phospho-L-lactate guanylyltransferase
VTIALLPVKRLEESKSRLLARLSDEDRQALTLAMFEDVVEALSATPGVERIAVTTPDPTVADCASAAGVEVILRPEPGLNEALEDARSRLLPNGGDDLLFVLGDVAGALPTDFAALLEAARGQPPGVWLAPSSDGGSSAVLHHPAGVIPCLFGHESARRHREAAARARVVYHEIPLPSLAIDLDAPEDLEAFLRTQGGGTRTRLLLASITSPAVEETH